MSRTTVFALPSDLTLPGDDWIVTGVRVRFDDPAESAGRFAGETAFWVEEPERAAALEDAEISRIGVLVKTPHGGTPVALPLAPTYWPTWEVPEVEYVNIGFRNDDGGYEHAHLFADEFHVMYISLTTTSKGTYLYGGSGTQVLVIRGGV